ncbi:MAG TPA: Uma2 family endonuclease [Chloroflexota bacterium]|jgi:Uma2 family endonuclease
MATATDLQSRPPLTVAEFKALAEEEGWDEDDRVELLDGEVIWLSPIGDPHAGCVNRLTRLFTLRYRDAALVSPQNPVLLGDYDEPQPDLALLQPRADYYGTSTPTPPDILLLVEVADTTLRTDLGRKARIYAGAGVVEYWVVDLNKSVVYVHRDPRQGGYATRQVSSRGGRLMTQFAPDVVLEVGEILP